MVGGAAGLGHVGVHAGGGFGRPPADRDGSERLAGLGLEPDPVAARLRVAPMLPRDPADRGSRGASLCGILGQGTVMTEHEAIQTIWNYMLMRHQPRPADVLLVLCSYDLRVAEYAAELFRRGLAPRVTISGGGHPAAVTSSLWDRPEAEMFAQVMRQHGVPDEVMWLETRSANTGENAQLTDALWRQRKFDPKTVLALGKPYMERRIFATLKKWWPRREIIVSSPPVSFDEWVAGSPVGERFTVNAMVGDLWRIQEYPARGFQIPQEIPAAVWTAYEALTALGYGRQVRPGPEVRPAT